MKLDLSEIAHSQGMHYTYGVDEPADEFKGTDLTVVEPVRGKLTFSNTGQLLLARGRLTAIIDLECGRCLGHFPFKQVVVVEEQFPLHPGLEPGTKHPNEEFDALDDTLDGVEGIFQDFHLDLTELVRQNVLVELPIAPLCSEECLGLCPQCGKNLNEGACTCVPDVEGPMSVLKDLLEEKIKPAENR